MEVLSYDVKVLNSNPGNSLCLVIDALVNLSCRTNISAEILWDGGWLLRQLLPYSVSEFNSHHLDLLKRRLEVFGPTYLFLFSVMNGESAKESSSPRKEPNCILLLPWKISSGGHIPEGSSFAAGKRMHELVKVFVLLHQLQIFTLGKTLTEQPLIYPPGDLPANCRAQGSGLDVSGPKAGTEDEQKNKKEEENKEVKGEGNALPCRIAFERGKELHVYFLAISLGISGWLVVAEELPLKKSHGLVRAVAPLAGCNPRIEDNHAMWLHLRIRASSLPFIYPVHFKDFRKKKTRASVDGRWTLAFKDEETCKSAFLMTVEEINFLSNEVHRRLKPLLNLETSIDLPGTIARRRTRKVEQRLNLGFHGNWDFLIYGFAGDEDECAR
ncbi:hypothetical protein V8G54_016291 [Vigna mungo]|uniref:Uncharacterized protein n=1 Tax=Vigna mungo TaxID=3915 RepID=A0AAQ3S103_VIGMU